MSNNNNNAKWWLSAVVAVCCLTPMAFAESGPAHSSIRYPERACDPHLRNGCHQAQVQAVPEGGSTAIYLLGAGLICFGAMFLRSRVAEPI
jgi:hypothetical protein